MPSPALNFLFMLFEPEKNIGEFGRVSLLYESNYVRSLVVCGYDEFEDGFQNVVHIELYINSFVKKGFRLEF